MLLIDAGNTAIKYRRINHEEIVEEWVFYPERNEKPFWGRQRVINEEVWISSVRGEEIPLPEGSSIHWIHPGLNFPFQISDTLKNNLGADRLCAYAALTQFCQADQVACAVTLGTAITYNLMLPGFQAVGGAISPGPAMRFSSLHQATRKLPLAEVGEALVFPAEKTQDAIRAGVIQGIAYELNGFAEEICHRFSEDTHFFLCGGFALNFENHFKKRNFVLPDLVLKGLYRLALLNRNA